MEQTRKFELHKIEDVPEFTQEVVRLGGMCYVWWKTNTVVVRGNYPTNFPMDENHDVTEYDHLMLNISGV
jgi:hypothetical protein